MPDTASTIDPVAVTLAIVALVIALSVLAVRGHQGGHGHHRHSLRIRLLYTDAGDHAHLERAIAVRQS